MNADFGMKESSGPVPVSKASNPNMQETIETEVVTETLDLSKQIQNKSQKSKSISGSGGVSRTASVPGKPRGATYDGNMCMICSDRASGFHYGVLACEGCKGFFKRVCKEKLKSSYDSDDSMQNHKRQCVFGGNCEINVRTRNRCQYCRIQKCIELGMSKDGIKLGRRSKKFKQNLSSISATNKETPHPVQQAQTTTEINEQPKPKQLIGIIQENKIIFKAIDILTAAATTTNTSPQISNEYSFLNQTVNTEQSSSSSSSSSSSLNTKTEPENSNFYILPANQANLINGPIFLLNSIEPIMSNSLMVVKEQNNQQGFFNFGFVLFFRYFNKKSIFVNLLIQTGLYGKRLHAK